jgi:hypothetical protein
MDGARSQASQRLLSFDARAAVWVARSGWEGVFYCSRPRGWPPRLARSGACEVSERARSPCWGRDVGFGSPRLRCTGNAGN